MTYFCRLKHKPEIAALAWRQIKTKTGKLLFYVGQGFCKMKGTVHGKADRFLFAAQADEQQALCQIGQRKVDKTFSAVRFAVDKDKAEAFKDLLRSRFGAVILICFQKKIFLYAVDT